MSEHARRKNIKKKDKDAANLAPHTPVEQQCVGIFHMPSHDSVCNCGNGQNRRTPMMKEQPQLAGDRVLFLFVNYGI